MKDYKQIKVSPEVHKKLLEIKVELEVKTLNDAIEHCLK